MLYWHYLNITNCVMNAVVAGGYISNIIPSLSHKIALYHSNWFQPVFLKFVYLYTDEIHLEICDTNDQVRGSFSAYSSVVSGGTSKSDIRMCSKYTAPDSETTKIKPEGTQNIEKFDLNIELCYYTSVTEYPNEISTMRIEEEEFEEEFGTPLTDFKIEISFTSPKGNTPLIDLKCEMEEHFYKQRIIDHSAGCKSSYLNECYKGDCCNLETGTLRTQTELCRPKLDCCDIAEYCTGISDSCPKDDYFPDGMECSNNGICMKGICQSEKSICKRLHPLFIPGSETCKKAFGLDFKVHKDCDTFVCEAPRNLSIPPISIRSNNLTFLSVEDLWYMCVQLRKDKEYFHQIYRMKFTETFEPTCNCSNRHQRCSMQKRCTAFMCSTNPNQEEQYENWQMVTTIVAYISAIAIACSVFFVGIVFYWRYNSFQIYLNIDRNTRFKNNLDDNLATNIDRSDDEAFIDTVIITNPGEYLVLDEESDSSELTESDSSELMESETSTVSYSNPA